MRTRHPRALRSTLLILAAGVLFGCGATVVPSPPVSVPTTPVPATDLACQEVEFDPAASLGPEFANDIFVGAESEVIAGAFIAGLAGLYARRPNADPCAWFTARDLRTALETDARLRDAIEGRSSLESDLVMRIAFEGVYDLRATPPTDPLSIIFETIGLSLGMPIDPLIRNEFVRDPAGEFLARGWITAPFEPATKPPADAAYTGWTNGNIELWISPTDIDAAVYLRVGDAMERWPRAADAWGVIDCN